MTSWISQTRGGVASMLFVLALINPNANLSPAEEPGEATREADNHPLAPTLQYATSRSEYIRENIRDYSCRLIKRERIDGKLQSYQFITVKMRCEQVRDGEVVPMAVFMQYLAPKSLRDRRVLYVEGENNGRMLVRKGGRSLKNVKLRIDPHGTSARRESNYPITAVGFDKMIKRLTSQVTEDIKHDPTAANTLVSHFRDARVGDRACTRIQVIHPRRGDGITFHEANLFIDDELQVPIRLTVHDWPKKEGDEMPLIEEYTYVNLQLNVGLSDAEFSETKLESSAERAAKTASTR